MFSKSMTYHYWYLAGMFTITFEDYTSFKMIVVILAKCFDMVFVYDCKYLENSTFISCKWLFTTDFSCKLSRRLNLTIVSVISWLTSI